MAEELTIILILNAGISIRYRYTERIEIMEGLRSGSFDVLVGVNSA
jgi:excinuclease UvrABC helicase subunit UvrB